MFRRCLSKFLINGVRNHFDCIFDHIYGPVFQSEGRPNFSLVEIGDVCRKLLSILCLLGYIIQPAFFLCQSELSLLSCPIFLLSFLLCQLFFLIFSFFFSLNAPFLFIFAFFFLTQPAFFLHFPLQLNLLVLFLQGQPLHFEFILVLLLHFE